MHPKVDEYLMNTDKWHHEVAALRHLLLDCQLTEEFKWRTPCYTFQKKNIAIIGTFKNYCGLSFFKGVLLSDHNKLLHTPGENSQSVRLFKFTSVEEINKLEAIIKTYILEALEIEKAGLSIPKKETTSDDYPSELKESLDTDLILKQAFDKLTPGRQRGYVIYFSSPKQSKTRQSRIQANRERIINGFGFHDCTCGRSQKMPTCDGTHKS